MASRKEIWFFRNSPAAIVVNALGRRYKLRDWPESAKTNGEAVVPLGAGASCVVCLADLDRDDLAALGKLARRRPDARLICLQDRARRNEAGDTDGWRESQVFAYLPHKVPRAMLERTVAAAFSNMELAARERAAREELERTRQEMEELNRIGVALSARQDLESLLTLILQKVREITGADAGSLYLVEEKDGQRQLRFKLTQNDSRQFRFTEFTLPITETSMAGYVALHGQPLNLPDAYAIPRRQPYHFNASYDQDSGYRTRSVLTLPMKNAKGEVTGVLQLINCKRDRQVRLESDADISRHVHPFPEHAVRLAMSLASQAAVAYENRKLYEDIERLFEGFVKAAVLAIEQRDPTTSGHSSRVSTLTVGLAETVGRAEVGPYAGTRFSREEMKEIRYAALLHDFGKVGVREEVLVKAKKLYPAQLDVVQQRFDYVRKELEARITRQKLQLLLERGRERAQEAFARLDEECRRGLEELDDYFQFIASVNEPTVMPEGEFSRLREIARKTFVDPRGVQQNLLEPDEVRYLSIPKGSLDDGERKQIESHVIHTFEFLKQIPWTKEIQRIPQIARAHHELLDGTGYPYRLRGDEIPLPAKMMTICDIFDALTASDRPYKRAVPAERALDILNGAVRESQLDPVLFQFFLDAGIYRLTMKRS
jgi:HD-GYP domain-containing protein (c-di-GMP phosphodiesterase class II)